MRRVGVVSAAILAAAAACAQTHDLPMPLYEINLFDARPESACQAAYLLSRYAATTRASPGCLRLDLVRQPPPAANHLAVVVKWHGAADHDRQLSSAAALAFRTYFQPLAANPVDERLNTRTAQ